MQTRTDSLMEALANIVVGFTINFIANIIFLPMVLGVPINLHELGLIGAIFTVISLVRSYALRRLFNGRTIWQAIKDRFGPVLTIKDQAKRDYMEATARAEQARQRVLHLIGMQ